MQSDQEQDQEGELTLEQRQKRERKELQAKIQALKKSATKGDKKRKKEVLVEIAQLEADLDRKHQEELLNADLSQRRQIRSESKDADETLAEHLAETTLNDDNNTTESQPLSESTRKPNRQQLRKQKKLAQMEQMRQQALEESQNQVNWKQVEDEAIRDILQLNKLSIHEITPDGHCLYSAVAHQYGLDASLPKKDYKEMRKLASEHMQQHMNEFLPFAASEDSADFVKYCEKVACSAEWGGQLEIMALSQALRRPIHIFQMGSPTLKIGEELSGEPLLLSYHRHSYGLGEHYNSLIKQIY